MYIYMYIYVFMHTHIYWERDGEGKKKGREKREAFSTNFKNVKYKLLTCFVIELSNVLSLIFYILYLYFSKSLLLLPWTLTILLSAFMSLAFYLKRLKKITWHLSFNASVNNVMYFRLTHLSQMTGFLMYLHICIYMSYYF